MDGLHWLLLILLIAALVLAARNWLAMREWRHHANIFRRHRDQVAERVKKIKQALED